MTNKLETPVDQYQSGLIAHNLEEGCRLQQAGGSMLTATAKQLAMLAATPNGKPLAVAEVKQWLILMEEHAAYLVRLFNNHPADCADEIGFPAEGLTMADVKRAAKNRKDAAAVPLRRAFKKVNLVLEIGKQQQAAKKSVTIKRADSKPTKPANPASGKDKTPPVPTTGEMPNVQPAEVQSVDSQLAMVLAAIDALPAEYQDKVAKHLQSVISKRVDANGKPVNQIMANQLRKAQAAAPAAVH